MTPDEVRAVRRRSWPAGSWSRCRAASTSTTLRRYAAAGADLISTSAITQSAPALDLGLDLRGVLMTATVVVRGTGTASARPDRAVLRLRASATPRPPRPRRCSNVAERTAPLEAVLRERGVGDADWTTTGVTVQAGLRVATGPARAPRPAGGEPAPGDRPATRPSSGRLLTDAVEVGRRARGRPAVDRGAGQPGPPRGLPARPRPTPVGGPRPTPIGLGLALGPVVRVDETRHERADAAWAGR